MNAEDEIDQALKERNTPKQDARWTSDKRWVWFWAGMLAISLPMLIPYLLGMWSFEHYRYIPFVFLVVGYLIWTRSDRVLRAPTGWFAWTLVVTSILTIVVALSLPSTWLAGLAFVVLAATCIGSMRGPFDRTLLGSAVPLLMLIQMPVGMDQRLINSLQGLTTDLSSVLLDILGVPHAVEGNTLQLVSRELFVADACSGIQSVFTLSFIACVVVAINRRRLWLTPIYLLIAVFLALAGNTIRVSAVALAEHWFAADLSSGWQHDILGYATLGIATAFLLSFDQLIVTVLHPANVGGDSSMDSPFIRAWNYLVADWRIGSDDSVYGFKSDKDSSQTRASKQSPLDKLVLNPSTGYAALALLGVIGIAAAVRATQVEVNKAPKTLVGSYILFDPKPDLMDGQYSVTTVSGHQSTRNGTEERLGQNADLWEAKVGERHAQIVVSQTYRGWHELCVCYRNMDWKQLSRLVTDPPDSEADPANPESFITARFQDKQGNFGYLLYTAVNEDGTVAEAPSALEALGGRFFTRLERHGYVTLQDSVMFQMWLVSPDKISSGTLRKMQSDFIEMRSRLSVSIVADAVDQTKPTSHRENTEG